MAKVKASFSLPKSLVELLAPFKKARRAELVKRGLVHAGLVWARKVLPDHFKAGAASKWPGAYKRRDSEYTRRKVRERGHRDPMVLTGEFRRSMLGRKPTMEHRTSGRSLRVNVTLPCGDKAKYHTGPPKSRFDFKKEILAWNRADYELLRQAAEREVRRILKREMATGPVEVKRFVA